MNYQDIFDNLTKCISCLDELEPQEYPTTMTLAWGGEWVTITFCNEECSDEAYNLEWEQFNDYNKPCADCEQGSSHYNTTEDDKYICAECYGAPRGLINPILFGMWQNDLIEA